MSAGSTLSNKTVALVHKGDWSAAMTLFWVADASLKPACSSQSDGQRIPGSLGCGLWGMRRLMRVKQMCWIRVLR